MNKTKVLNWMKANEKNIKMAFGLMNRQLMFTHVNMNNLILQEADPMEKFIRELTYAELKRKIKSRDWYYLYEVRIEYQRVRDELFL